MTSYVYFARYGEYLKIGTTRRLFERMEQHKHLTKGKMKFMFAVPGGSKLELHLHRTLRDHKARGDFFLVSEADIEEMRSIAKQNSGYIESVPKMVSKIVKTHSGVTDQLRAIGYENRITQQKLMREAINLIFQKYGRAEIA